MDYGDYGKRWADFLQKKPPYSVHEIEKEDFWFLSEEFEIKIDAFVINAERKGFSGVIIKME